MRGSVLAIAALASALPAARVAGQDPRPPDQAELRVEALPDVIISRRARLGLKVNLQARESDSVGAYVDLVTPGGPAADAGLRAGDVITRLDGQALLESPADRGQRGRSLPGLRLIRLAARLEPGDTVPVDYRRGAERRTTSLVTDADQLVHVEGRRLPAGMAFRVSPRAMGAMPAFRSRPFELPAPAFELFLAGDLAELELAPLNADLGQYFGTGDGVLVISAPRDSRLGVRGGDVVLAVDGRKPDGPLHLLRILRSYDGGERFKLDILRSRKRESLTASLAAPTEER
jgi:S1-C subfamily serine protease